MLRDRTQSHNQLENQDELSQLQQNFAQLLLWRTAMLEDNSTGRCQALFPTLTVPTLTVPTLTVCS